MLGGLKDQRAGEPLLRAFRREGNPDTGHAMLEALKSLGVQPDVTWEQMDEYRLQEGARRKAKEELERQKKLKREQESKKKAQY